MHVYSSGCKMIFMYCHPHWCTVCLHTTCLLILIMVFCMHSSLGTLLLNYCSLCSAAFYCKVHSLSIIAHLFYPWSLAGVTAMCSSCGDVWPILQLHQPHYTSRYWVKILYNINGSVGPNNVCHWCVMNVIKGLSW